MKIRAVLVSGVFLILASLAADLQGAPRWRPPRPNPVNIDGTVEGIGRGMIMAVNDKDQRQWAITPEPTTKILVTGTATVDFLRPKMLAQFNAQVDEKGVVKDKVGELTVVTADTANQPVAPPAKSKGGSKSAKAEKPAAADDAGSRVGLIMGVHGHKVSVKSGGKMLQFELSEDAKINISVDIVGWAAKGDKIQVKGKSISSRPGLCYAEELTITLAEPLTGGKKKIAPKADADSANKAATPKKSAAADFSADLGGETKPKKKKKPADDEPAPASDDKK